MRPANSAARQSLTAVLRQGPLGTPTIAAALGVSGRSVLRMLEELGPIVVAAGVAGRRRYALRRPLRGSVTPLPVFAIDRHGKATEAGQLDLLAPEGAHFDLNALGWPVDEAARDGWWRGLPYPLYDMRPQGFLGRAFAARTHQILEVPANPAAWSDDDIVFVLSRRGHDTTGNLLVGEPALRQFQQTLLEPESPLRAARTAAAYADQATATTSLGTVGSSAAGEFPKFTAVRELAGAATPHVIVKFSGGDGGAASTRWADLLVCEHLALTHAAELPGVHAAPSRVLAHAGRTFLESERFDRHGPHGRSPVMTLDSLQGHLLGLAAEDWRTHATALRRRGILDDIAAGAIAHLWWYGRLIANSDMHLGNLGLIPTATGLACAPAYDMLPMRYAPLPGGEVPPRAWTCELPAPADRAVWKIAAKCAIDFWLAAASDKRVSTAFRSIARANAATVDRLAEKV